MTARSRPDLELSSIPCDPASGLPRFEAVDLLLATLLHYLPLPYSVAEYGCGKKASVILRQLRALGVPAHAMCRGLILEPDMSPSALATNSARERPGALRIANPLFELGDLRSPTLRRMLANSSVRVEGDAVYAGRFPLRFRREVQFVEARSHVFVMIAFWDDARHRVAWRIVDPTIDPASAFEVAEIRRRLSSAEALVFAAPILGTFRLIARDLTPAQRDRIAELGWHDVATLGADEHRSLVLALTAAAPGSIGDPATWTYANSIRRPGAHERDQAAATGRGEPLREATAALHAAREADRDVAELRERARRIASDLAIDDAIHADARWSEEELRPLAHVAITMQCHGALESLSGWVADKASITSMIDDRARRWQLRGLGARLRDRIERVAAVSRRADGTIDARALNPRFRDAAIEVIRQMNEAGLTVFVDAVGNLHGLYLSDAQRARVAARPEAIQEIASSALAFVSHIDTVEDAGRYDGRLGVLSGIEVVHVLHDLDAVFGTPLSAASRRAILVSAYSGEEMTFTGNGVSMPGSAAVAGLARVDDVLGMTDPNGVSYRDELTRLLVALHEAQTAGEIEFRPRLPGDRRAMLASCHDPTWFFTPHTFERHIEQGAVLARADARAALVHTIMGIRQRDIVFRGDRAEPAALEFVRRSRLALEGGRARITVGVLVRAETEVVDHTAFAMRCRFRGVRDHAGAADLADRRDPLVAAAEFVAALHRGDHAAWTIGDVAIDPGTARNVVPGEAALTVALPAAAEPQVNALVARARESIATSGVSVDIEPADDLTVARSARVSTDLRAATTDEIEQHSRRIDELANTLAAEFDVSCTTYLEQQMNPTDLAASGQALLLDRSYGGSHNPKEVERADDVLASTLLQLDVTRHVLSDEADGALFDQTRRCLPRAWRNRLDGMVSGALHDTCNIAIGAGRA